MRVSIPQIVAPDSSHWAKWIDAALGSDRERRISAQGFHERMLTAGRIPFISWHHLEELLCIADEDWARRRVAFIQSLPLVAFMRLPWEQAGTGSLIEIVAAKVIAALNGRDSVKSVRATSREMLMQTGSGLDAIGSESWVWEAARPQFLERHNSAKLITSTRSMGLFDESRTVGEIARGSIRTPADLQGRLDKLYSEVGNHIRTRGDAEIANPGAMTSEFMQGVMDFTLPAGMDVRGLIEWALVSQGVDPHEITDDRLLSDLSELALFRAKLRVIADRIGRPYDSIKHVDMRVMPSWQIERALKIYGQDRQRRSGSDLNDGHLSAIAPYTDELFVDKRTAEDFRRIKSRGGEVASIICTVRKSADFENLASDP